MGMSDCEKCWDTPCTCGFQGYLTVWLDGRDGERFAKLSTTEKDKLMDALYTTLAEELGD